MPNKISPLKEILISLFMTLFIPSPNIYSKLNLIYKMKRHFLSIASFKIKKIIRYEPNSCLIYGYKPDMIFLALFSCDWEMQKMGGWLLTTIWLKEQISFFFLGGGGS